MTALASWLEARRQRGAWLLRIDDLDVPRCVPGAADQVLAQLEAHGLQWDEAPRYQSNHVADYETALGKLAAEGALYACRCTRAVLAQSARPGPDGAVYPGTCRGSRDLSGPCATRLQVSGGTLCFEDGWQGRQCRDLESEVGDFSLRRSDGLLSYQLACAIDEAAQGITDVVRGVDLLGSSFRQLHLQQRLGLPSPAYRHLPVLVDATGQKLSKQNHAPAVSAAQAAANLHDCLRHLRQAPPAALRGGHHAAVLDWALNHWQPERLRDLRTLAVE